MLIRSGLIQNFPAIDAAAFTRHWREVHGPIASRLPNLRGYVQNHITASGKAARANLLHRIDGISQLWFDNVASMKEGMTSPEQDACVADISGFLERVTLAVQHPGVWRGESADGRAQGSKLMAVYAGDGTAADVEREVASRLTGEFAALRHRINPIIGNEFIVDSTIARSTSPIIAVVEAFFSDDAKRGRVLAAELLNQGLNVPPAGVFAVTAYTFIDPPAER